MLVASPVPCYGDRLVPTHIHDSCADKSPQYRWLIGDGGGSTQNGQGCAGERSLMALARPHNALALFGTFSRDVGIQKSVSEAPGGSGTSLWVSMGVLGFSSSMTRSLANVLKVPTLQSRVFLDAPPLDSSCCSPSSSSLPGVVTPSRLDTKSRTRTRTSSPTGALH